MRIASFNIHHGVGTDGRCDLARVADEIAGLDADVVALQELDVGWRRSGGVDQPTTLAEMLGLVISFHPTFVRPDGSSYGLAVAARGRFTARYEQLPKGDEREPRGVIKARIGGVTFLATHLTRDRASRARQIAYLADRVGAIEGPVVVVGDMNASKRPLRPLFEAGLSSHRGAVRTVPARFARSQIDHILAGGGLRVVSARSIRTDASDHRPLVAEVVPDRSTASL